VEPNQNGTSIRFIGATPTDEDLSRYFF